MAIVAGMAALITGCATSIAPRNPPLLIPFGDGTQWIVGEDIEFAVELDDKSEATIRVPRGFVTDLASTPPDIWKWYPPFGKYLTASILHDYLYWRQSCTQEEADKILARTMRGAGSSEADQERFFRALKAFGSDALALNKKEKEQGLLRILPPEYLRLNFNGRTPTATWRDLRKSLHDANVPEPPQLSDANIPRVCAALGREITVKASLWTVLFGK